MATPSGKGPLSYPMPNRPPSPQAIIITLAPPPKWTIPVFDRRRSDLSSSPHKPRRIASQWFPSHLSRRMQTYNRSWLFVSPFSLLIFPLWPALQPLITSPSELQQNLNHLWSRSRFILPSLSRPLPSVRLVSHDLLSWDGGWWERLLIKANVKSTTLGVAHWNQRSPFLKEGADRIPSLLRQQHAFRREEKKGDTAAFVEFISSATTTRQLWAVVRWINGRAGPVCWPTCLLAAPHFRDVFNKFPLATTATPSGLFLSWTNLYRELYIVLIN